MNVLVSVVIPVYNGEKFIRESIKSVLDQKYKNIEIVVVNDCSTDNTEKIIQTEFKNYLNSKLIYIKNSENSERAYSRNIGVEVAKGKYIYFLDYDDKWDADYIVRTIRFFNEFDIVYSVPRKIINWEGRVIKVSTKSFPNNVEDILFSSMIGYPSGTGVKKDKFLGYKTKYIPREDWEFYLRSFFEKRRIKILDNNLVNIREHTERTSKNINFYKSTLKVYEDYINKIPERYKATFLFHIGEVCLRFGDFIRGWKFIKTAYKLDPKILNNRRNILSLLKRSIRIDRFLKKGR